MKINFEPLFKREMLVSAAAIRPLSATLAQDDAVR